MKLYLIRHGKTLANENRLYCGKTDIPLSESGIDEVKKYAGIYNIRADSYITSGMLRTNMTMKLMFGIDNPEIQENLAEMDFGEFEMKSHDELVRNASYRHWIDDVQNYKCPGGESGAEAVNRVVGGIEDVISRCLPNNKDAVCVLHGGVTAIIMDRFFPGRARFYDWQPKCCEGYMITVNKGGRAVEWSPLPFIKEINQCQTC